MQCDKIEYSIKGEGHPCLVVVLDPGEVVVAEAGAMVWMDPHIGMETKMGDGRGRKKGYAFSGIVQAVSRKLTKENLFFTHFRNNADEGKARVAFTSPVPGSIAAINLGNLDGEPLMCQKGAFLAAAYGTKLTWGTTGSVMGGIFGGEGYLLQEIHGDGMAFLSCSGSVIRMDLAPGQVQRVDTGCLLAWSKNCEYNVTTVKGVASMFLGREGMFLTTLTGPGRIYIQTLPIERAALALYQYMPKAVVQGK